MKKQHKTITKKVKLVALSKQVKLVAVHLVNGSVMDITLTIQKTAKKEAQTLSYSDDLFVFYETDTRKRIGCIGWCDADSGCADLCPFPSCLCQCRHFTNCPNQ